MFFSRDAGASLMRSHAGVSMPLQLSFLLSRESRMRRLRKSFSLGFWYLPFWIQAFAGMTRFTVYRLNIDTGAWKRDKSAWVLYSFSKKLRRFISRRELRRLSRVANYGVWQTSEVCPKSYV